MFRPHRVQIRLIASWSRAITPAYHVPRQMDRRLYLRIRRHEKLTDMRKEAVNSGQARWLIVSSSRWELARQNSEGFECRRNATSVHTQHAICRSRREERVASEGAIESKREERKRRPSREASARMQLHGHEDMA